MKFIENLFKKKLALEKLYLNGEFSQVADLKDIFYCFRLILGRNPNPEECVGHSGMQGVDLERVVKSYVQSREFQDRNLLTTQLARLEVCKIEDFQIYVDMTDQAVGIALANASYEPHVTSIFKQFVKPGMRVIDIGANIGYFSLLAAQIVGNNGAVYSIEPNMDNCKLLQASKNLNKFEQISILQVAASDTTSLLTLNTSYSNGTTSTLSQNAEILMASRTVPAIKIDSYKIFDAGVDFIKIDIEGAEYRALKGASRLIERCKPVIVSEFSPTAMPSVSGVDGVTYLKFLVSLGYDISVIHIDGSIQKKGADYDAVIKAFYDSGVDHIDILMTPKV